LFHVARFRERLGTHRLGQTLVVRAITDSTNDDAWDALATRGDGTAVVALEQARGRGRLGRSWHQAPGKGLALSVALHLGCDVRQAGLIPLAAGLAALRAAHALGVGGARLKWPNDVLVNGKKLAGVLCEVRSTPRGDAAVIGVGMNVLQSRDDFPETLRDSATSLALEGSDAGLAEAAAAFLTEMEPLWAESQEGDRAAFLAAWSAQAPHWGERLRVRTPTGEVEGVALRLDADGALVLRLASGAETTVLAGDVMAGAAGGERP
jgi:BirA family biotin operon repressor/biotin-[acetyl-CoA-carboxylase] ligase